jgi:uroporphyrinogen decarboxylase
MIIDSASDVALSSKAPSLKNSPFIRACYGENQGRIPVWVMRQAGRYLPEYRALREKVSFLELCRTPEHVAKATTDPITRFGFDAAILFSDILPLLEPMGFSLEYAKGGPQVTPAIETPADVSRLQEYDVSEKMSYVFDGVRAVKKSIPHTPLLGFAGSPFTLACYAIEGHGSKTFDKVKRFMYQHPKQAEELLERITSATVVYLQEQVKAGADGVQLFDSWGGILSVDEYQQWSLKHTRRIFEALKSFQIPRVLFVNNLAPYIHLVAELDCEVVGVDYRMDLAQAQRALPGKAIQGNLDPNILFCAPDEVKQRTLAMLEALDSHDNLIANLGHGILPQAPIESVSVFVETVHSFRS